MTDVYFTGFWIGQKAVVVVVFVVAVVIIIVITPRLLYTLLFPIMWRKM
jgi:hypothetical protein